MKRIIAIVILVMISLCFSSCRSSKDMNSSDANVSSGTTSESTLDSTIIEEPTNAESNTESSVESNAEQQPSSTQQPSSIRQPSSTQQPSSNTQPKAPTKTKPNFGKLVVSIKDLTKQVPYYSFELTGKIVDCLVDEDLIYIVCKNKINLYDGNTGKVVYSNFLPSRPAEMHMYGDELWISFPELSCINIYNKSDFKLLKTVKMSKVFSFDVDDNYIYFSGEARQQFVYRYNLTTQKEELLFLDNDTLDKDFFEPAILVDKNTSMLYVAETNTTACKLYLYNTETLELCGVFESTPSSGPSVGFGNDVRKILLLDGYVYWNGFKVNPTVLWKAEQSYGSEDGGPGILFADSDYVATRVGVYENISGKLVVPFKPHSLGFEENSKFAITKSKNIMYSDGEKLYIFYG